MAERPNVLTRTFVVLVIVAAAAYVAEQRASPGPESPTTPGSVAGTASVSSGEERILRNYRESISGVWVEADGTVQRMLPDERQGPRHQRFILTLSSGHTLLVSHNIDLADRIDQLRVGDHVAFRGEYEWNARGGVVHWTHRDPSGRGPGGWLEHQGRRYQ